MKWFVGANGVRVRAAGGKQVKPRGGWGPAEARDLFLEGGRCGRRPTAALPASQAGGGTKQDMCSRCSMHCADAGQVGETRVLGEGDAPDQAKLF